VDHITPSVEEVRAGDTGKGFAVVAVEVRRHARAAATASDDVTAVVEASSVQIPAGGKLEATAEEMLTAMPTAVRPEI